MMQNLLHQLTLWCRACFKKDILVQNLFHQLNLWRKVCFKK